MNEICSEIADIFSRHGIRDWASAFYKLASNKDANGLARSVLRLYGGSGSFNDIVLMNGAVVSAENCRLDDRRRELYNKALEYLRAD